MKNYINSLLAKLIPSHDPTRTNLGGVAIAVGIALLLYSQNAY